MVLDPDFSISSDALETFIAIFTAERKPTTTNDDLDEFMAKHGKEILRIFDELKSKTMPHDGTTNVTSETPRS